jgi:hypothetical protein
MNLKKVGAEKDLIHDSEEGSFIIQVFSGAYSNVSPANSAISSGTKYDNRNNFECELDHFSFII